MGYIRFQYLFIFILMMFTIFGMEDKNDMDNNLETNSINEQVAGNDILEERAIEKPNYVFDFKQLNNNIHGIINQYLKVNEQGLYSILNKNMAQIRRYYLSTRVKALLYRPPREELKMIPQSDRGLKKSLEILPKKKLKTELSGNKVLSFEKSFHYLMKYTNDINHFYSIKNVPEVMEYADMPPLSCCEFCQQECKSISNRNGRSLCNSCYKYELQFGQMIAIEPKRKRKTEKKQILWGGKSYTYDATTGIFDWQPSNKSCKGNISLALPTFPLAIKYTRKRKTHLELLRNYHINHLQVVDQDINLIELQLQVDAPHKGVFSCQFKTNADARTNVQSVSWDNFLNFASHKHYAVHYSYACTVTDNQLFNTGHHKIDAIIFVDSEGTFKIIHTVPEENSKE